MVEAIVNYVQTNLVSLGVGTGAIAIILVLLKQGLGLAITYEENIVAIVKAKIFELVNEVEKSIEGSGLGELKKSTVFTQIMSYVPSIFKLFFTESEINKWIDENVISMKLMVGSITQTEADASVNALNSGSKTSTGTVTTEKTVRKA